jgi:hypothetical protein
MKEKIPGQQPRPPENNQSLQGRAEGRQSLQGPTTVGSSEQPTLPQESTLNRTGEGEGEGGKVYTLKTPSEEQLANVNRELLKFAGFVFTRELERELTPQGFVLSAQLALKDLENGIDTKTGQPIKGLFASLTFQPPMVYHLLDIKIPEISDLFFDPEFAREIRTYWNKVDTHRRQELRTIYSSNSNLTE